MITKKRRQRHQSFQLENFRLSSLIDRVPLIKGSHCRNIFLDHQKALIDAMIKADLPNLNKGIVIVWFEAVAVLMTAAVDSNQLATLKLAILQISKMLFCVQMYIQALVLYI